MHEFPKQIVTMLLFSSVAAVTCLCTVSADDENVSPAPLRVPSVERERLDDGASVIRGQKEDAEPSGFNIGWVRLQHANALQLVPTLEKVVDARFVKFSADARTNMIVFSAAESLHEGFSILLADLDKPIPELTQIDQSSTPRVRIIPVRVAVASDLLSTLAGVVDPETSIRMSADRRTNSLLVSAPDSQFASVRELVGQLDVDVSK